MFLKSIGGDTESTGGVTELIRRYRSNMKPPWNIFIKSTRDDTGYNA